jgi:hypothetical protein
VQVLLGERGEGFEVADRVMIDVFARWIGDFLPVSLC